MILYTCEKCHKWQDVSVVNAIVAFFEDIGQAVRKSSGIPSPEIQTAQSTEQLVTCPNGCGPMTLVDPEDKIAIFKENKHSKPPVGSWDDWDKWVKDVYALLWEYAETFPWEHELKDRADLLLEHVPLEKETSKKTHGTPRDPLWEIVKELVDRDSVVPYEKMGYAPCYFCNGVNDEISNFHHESTCGIAQLRRLVWYKQETETPKKQEESTALFDVIGKAVLQHSRKRFEAQSSDDTVLAVYNVIYNDWSLVSADGKPVEIYRTKDELQTLADKHKIDLSKGWRLINVSGTRG